MNDVLAPATRRLLYAGAVAGPLFVLVFEVAGAVRAGYSSMRNTVSLLDLSGSGWQQIVNFLVAGALMILFAAGVRRTTTSRWGPRLLFLTGIGLMISGVFMPDGTDGYPIGTPRAPAQGSSWHNSLHGAGAVLWIVSVSIASFVLARGRTKGWAAYSIGSGVVVLVAFLVSLVATGQASGPLADNAGAIERVAGIVAMAWVMVLAVVLLREQSDTAPALPEDTQVRTS